MASKRQIDVGGVKIGGGAPVAIQSMTKTETADFDATMRQIHAIADAGGDLVRCAVPRDDDVRALERIVVESPIPVIADIHFNHTLALKAIDAGAHCVRINPGNIGGLEKTGEVVEKARAAGIPLRIGVNSGSLPKHLHELERESPVEALVAAAIEHVELMDRLDFQDFKVSIKSTNVPNTIASNRLLAAARSTTRSTSASPRPARSGRARSSRRSASARCWPTGWGTRSASRSPPSTPRRRSRSPGRSSRRSSCASAARC